MSEAILKDTSLITFRSSFFGSSVNIEPAVEEKEGMGSTHNLQVEVPDVRRTVSFFGKLKLQSLSKVPKFVTGLWCITVMKKQ